MMKLGIDYGLGTINDGLPTTDTKQVVGAIFTSDSPKQERYLVNSARTGV
ncbi:hypothetical protein [Coleofasciculus sp. H7-2]